MRLIRLLKNDLARESSDWVKDDIITQQQAEAICQRYDVDYHQVANRSYAYNVLMTLGFLFMGTALIILIGANWEDIPRAARMWGLIGLTTGTQLYAWHTFNTKSEGAGVGLFLLGNLFYGASIILIAQIYHLGEHMPDGIFWWALGSLPFALLTQSVWLMIFALGLSVIWFFVEASLGFNPYLFPLFTISAIWVLYVGKQSIVLFLGTVASIGLWIEYNLAEYWRNSYHFDFLVENVAVFVGLFIFAYAFSHWLRLKDSVKAKDYAAVLSIWTLRFALIGLLIMTFEEPWEELITAQWRRAESMCFILSIMAAASLYLTRNTQRLLAIFVLHITLFILIGIVMMLDLRTDAVYFQIASNIALVAAGIGLIMNGIKQGVSHYFFLGVLSILVTALIRYADLIGDYVGGAILFMFFAAVLLGAAKYWKHNNQIQEAKDA